MATSGEHRPSVLRNKELSYHVGRLPWCFYQAAVMTQPQACLHARAEGLPSACAEAALGPGIGGSTFPSSSATRKDKVLSHISQTCSKFSHTELVARSWHRPTVLAWAL